MTWTSSHQDEIGSPTGHPGETLADELAARSISIASLARDTQIPLSQLVDIIHGARSITKDTALRLAAYFGSSARFWLDRQAAYDMMSRRRMTDASTDHPPAV